MAPRRPYTRSAERKPGPKNGLVVMLDDPMPRRRGPKRVPAAGAAAASRTSGTARTKSRATKGRLPDISAEGCPTCGRKPGRGKKNSQAKNAAASTPLRRSSRLHPDSPPGGGDTDSSNGDGDPTTQTGGTAGDTNATMPGRRSGSRDTSPPVESSRVASGRIVKRFKPELRARRSKLLQGGENRCYRNSVLQCLFHVPAVIDHLESIHNDCPIKVDRCIICALKMLAEAYWSIAPEDTVGSDDKPKVPTRFSDIFHAACLADMPEMKVLAEAFEKHRQSDPHEFIQYLLNKLKQADAGIDALAWSDMFDIMRENTWYCEDCGQTFPVADGNSVNEGRVIQFEGIKDEVLSLKNCLTASMATEAPRMLCLSDDCREALKEELDRTASTRLTRLPKVLILIIGRMGWNHAKKRNVKDLRKVQLPRVHQPWFLYERQRGGSNV